MASLMVSSERQNADRQDGMDRRCVFLRPGFSAADYPPRDPNFPAPLPLHSSPPPAPMPAGASPADRIWDTSHDLPTVVTFLPHLTRDIWTTKVAKYRETRESLSRFSCPCACFVVQGLPQRSSAVQSPRSCTVPSLAPEAKVIAFEREGLTSHPHLPGQADQLSPLPGVRVTRTTPAPVRRYISRLPSRFEVKRMSPPGGSGTGDQLSPLPGVQVTCTTPSPVRRYISRLPSRFEVKRMSPPGGSGTGDQLSPLPGVRVTRTTPAPVRRYISRLPSRLEVKRISPPGGSGTGNQLSPLPGVLITRTASPAPVRRYTSRFPSRSETKAR